MNVSAWEVRAIRDGRKTQTRRVIKTSIQDWSEIRLGFFNPTKINRRGEEYAGRDVFGAYTDDGEWGLKCPFGQPGDLLWLREKFAKNTDTKGMGCIYYAADETAKYVLAEDNGEGDWVETTTDVPKSKLWLPVRWRPSTQMPRCASRDTLRIKSVRIERLQEISGPDCWAEGIESAGWDCTKWGSVTHCYRDLWNSTNGPDSWDANPFVWVIEHERVKE
mgnify:CR=1 FL=1